MIEVSNESDLTCQLKAHKKVVALFYASWCPFCVSFLPVFSKNDQGHSKFLRVRVDDYSNPLWEQYSLEVVPTIIFFERGKVSQRLDGRLGFGLSEKQFGDWLEKLREF